MEPTFAQLPWPPEAARYPGDGVRLFAAPGSNIALDFHGDPATAGLAVFSDGNHHVALEAAVREFLHHHPGAGDVLYTTTPPRRSWSTPCAATAWPWAICGSAARRRFLSAPTTSSPGLPPRAW
jgi:hypothetical protein